MVSRIVNFDDEVSNKRKLEKIKCTTSYRTIETMARPIDKLPIDSITTKVVSLTEEEDEDFNYYSREVRSRYS